MPNEIYTIALPIVLMALLALIGYWRGVYREAFVASSVVLGALIVQQWAGYDRGGDERWARDLFDMFGGLTMGQWQFVLSLVMLALVVLVIGYFLGGIVVRQPLSVRSQTLGSLLGLVNGAAIAGWILRYVYIALDGTSATSATGQSGVAQGFMIWAGWYPVALALLGAVLALVLPLLRPHPVAVIPPVPAAAPQAPVPPTAAFPVPASTTRVGGTLEQREASPWAPPSSYGEQRSYGQYGYGAAVPPTTASQVADDYRRTTAEAPTLAIPTRPVERDEQSDRGAGLAYSPPSPPAGPAVPPLPSSDQLAMPAGLPPEESTPAGSWTSEATTALPVETREDRGAAPGPVEPAAPESPPPSEPGLGPLPSEAPAQGEALPAEQAEQGTPEAGQAHTAQAPAQEPLDRCPNCGAPISENQYFCTECGRRVREPRQQ